MDIRVYFEESGISPFENWLENLKDTKGKARILTRLDRVEDGNFGDHKHVTEGVWELRFTFRPGYRIYYGLDGNTVVVLLCGGDKASQKHDIKRAVLYWQDY